MPVWDADVGGSIMCIVTQAPQSAFCLKLLSNLSLNAEFIIKVWGKKAVAE